MVLLGREGLIIAAYSTELIALYVMNMPSFGLFVILRICWSADSVSTIKENKQTNKTPLNLPYQKIHWRYFLRHNTY